MPNHYDDIREDDYIEKQRKEINDMKEEIDSFIRGASHEETRAMYKVMQILDCPPSIEDIIINFASFLSNPS